MEINDGDLLVMTGQGSIKIPEGWTVIKLRWYVRLWRRITGQRPTFCAWRIASDSVTEYREFLGCSPALEGQASDEI